MFRNFKQIKRQNGIISSVVIYSLLLELESFKLLKNIFKIFRICLWQPILCLQLYPESFTKSALLSLRIVHPYMIIIHGSSKIGLNCTLHHCTTLGCIEQHSHIGPILENNVYLGCNVTCLGEIVIRHDTVVGACSTVLNSTPPILV